MRQHGTPATPEEEQAHKRQKRRNWILAITLIGLSYPLHIWIFNWAQFGVLP